MEQQHLQLAREAGLMTAPLGLASIPATSGQTPSLERECGAEPGIVCRIIWDISHSQHAAAIAGPAEIAVRIVFVLVLALLLRAAAMRLVARISNRVLAMQDTGGRSHAMFRERRAQRATALASVLGNAASVLIFSIAAVIVLSDLGLNIAPVLASAGVLGVAFGFGAQNLVKDFLAGIFMLLEDQYGVGDEVQVSGVSGTVEAVSLRITRLRDVNGVVWHIRNGTIKQAGNASHGWARAVVDVPVPYQSELPAARAALQQAADAMWADSAWHDVLLEQPEVWGIQDMTATTVLVRVVARTAPLRQTEVTRELRERLKAAVDAGHLSVPAQAGPAQAGPAQAGPAQARPTQAAEDTG
jgi:small conductance mechanosensitive channel